MTIKVKPCLIEDILFSFYILLGGKNKNVAVMMR